MVTDTKKLNAAKTCKNKICPSNVALWIEPKTQMANKQGRSEPDHRNKRAKFKLLLRNIIRILQLLNMDTKSVIATQSFDLKMKCWRCLGHSLLISGYVSMEKNSLT